MSWSCHLGERPHQGRGTPARLPGSRPRLCGVCVGFVWAQLVPTDGSRLEPVCMGELCARVPPLPSRRGASRPKEEHWREHLVRPHEEAREGTLLCGLRQGQGRGGSLLARFPYSAPLPLAVGLLRSPGPSDPFISNPACSLPDSSVGALSSLGLHGRTPCSLDASYSRCIFEARRKSHYLSPHSDGRSSVFLCKLGGKQAEAGLRCGRPANYECGRQVGTQET